MITRQSDTIFVTSGRWADDEGPTWKDESEREWWDNAYRSQSNLRDHPEADRAYRLKFTPSGSYGMNKPMSWLHADGRTQITPLNHEKWELAREGEGGWVSKTYSTMEDALDAHENRDNEAYERMSDWHQDNIRRPGRPDWK